MKLIRLTAGEADKELDSSGLLFAINKLILHPFGLALALSFPDGAYDTAKDAWIAEPNDMGLFRSTDGLPLTFDDETGLRAKLKVFLDDREAKLNPPSNESLLNEAANPPKGDMVEFESYYQSSTHRTLLGYDERPPLLERDEAYGTCFVYTRRDGLMMFSGAYNDKRTNRIVVILRNAWRRDNVGTEPPETIAVPEWFYKIWFTLANTDQLAGLKMIVGVFEDRIYLVRPATN